MRKKPNFLIVGGAKCGSTSLYQYLSQHPQVFMPVNKEPNYFVRDYQQGMSKNCPNYKRSMKRMIFDQEDYYGLFSEAALSQICIGEATVTYLYQYIEAIKNIKAELGDPKIIIILRNPILRAFSQFSYISELGFEKLNFKNAISEEENRLNDNWSSTYAYIQQGMFFKQVQAYKKSFTNVHVLFLEELIDSPEKEMRKIFSFLEIDNSFQPQKFENFNSSGVPKLKLLNKILVHDNWIKIILRKLISQKGLRNLALMTRKWNQGKKLALDEQTKGDLKSIYKEDIMKLSELLNRDLNHWLSI